MPDRKTSWIVAILLLALGLFFVLVLYGAYRLMRPGKTEITQKSVLEVDLGGEIAELPSPSSLARLLDKDAVSMVDMERAFRAAAKDPQITSLFLSIHSLGMPWAQVEELRDFLKEFKKSNKKVITHLQLDMAEEKEMYLASLADEIYLNPDAGLLINGLAAEVEFYKRTMDKLKVEPQFLQFKEFKSAESFTREKMTPEYRSMLESILSDIQGRFVQTVAQERRIEPERLQELIKTGMATASMALKERLVTALGYEDEIQTKLLPEKSKEYRSVSVAKYLKAVRDRSGKKAKHRVALIGGLGPITSGAGDDVWGNIMGGETMAARLREIRKAKEVKGVLFRVNSPGGSAVGSDKVWREVRLLEREGKPVVVSMSGVAGSGGYYIAMGARKIVAQPSTITGSIGVIFGKFNVRGLYEHWLGITTDEIKLADNANIFSPLHSLSEEQKAQIRSWMEDIYHTFVKKAAEGRGMRFEELEAKAHGRIYTGSQAKNLKLIDEVGGLNTALALLKKELKIADSEEVELVLYPKPKSVWQSLAEGDFFGSSFPRVSVESLRQTVRSMETPAPWLLAPAVEIR
ncbi:MAG: signal peptide peptidase SppA [Acidobacteria bacterium]|nr:signal peptide peptidase SppA [Acidobacteriota bacterium]MCI0621350.1 signal peptide peptidase SppA [Acidobacteriota bacterium]MCI0720104.1 signal peptide peptidase SppA [Acidobacteriota bacterium]